MSVDPKHLQIVCFPHPVLRRQAEAIGEITDEVRAVAARMIDLMTEADGVGLAAPQVGIAWRLFVTAAREDEPQRVFVNPRVTSVSDESEIAEEGCLSLPHVRVEVRRAEAISVQATDLEGREFAVESDHLSARVWQHEMDHLNGVLIIDRMGPKDRIANRKAIRDLKASVEESAPTRPGTR